MAKKPSSRLRLRRKQRKPLAPTPTASPNQPKTIVANDPADRKGILRAIGGSQSDTWNHVLVNQVVRSLGSLLADEGERDELTRATVAALFGIEPRDETEGMLAAQMIAVHTAAMTCYRRAMSTSSFAERQESFNQANKLSRTYTQLLEALDRHRGKGQQKVLVEHVHVHRGGQAIVGNVEPRGAIEKGREQSKPAIEGRNNETTAQKLLPPPGRPETKRRRTER